MSHTQKHPTLSFLEIEPNWMTKSGHTNLNIGGLHELFHLNESMIQSSSLHSVSMIIVFTSSTVLMMTCWHAPVSKSTWASSRWYPFWDSFFVMRCGSYISLFATGGSQKKNIPTVCCFFDWCADFGSLLGFREMSSPTLARLLFVFGALLQSKWLIKCILKLVQTMSSTNSQCVRVV